MTIKTEVNIHSLLFLGISPIEDSTVIVTYDKSIQEKADAFSSHLAIYLEKIFRSVVWAAFPHEYKTRVSNFSNVRSKNISSRSVKKTASLSLSTIDTKDSNRFV